jgi:hypothetical protein
MGHLTWKLCPVCRCCPTVEGICPDCQGPSVTYNASKPGRKFVPDGKGGGTLHIVETATRRGFRPAARTLVIHKQPYAGR